MQFLVTTSTTIIYQLFASVVRGMKAYQKKVPYVYNLGKEP